MQLEAGDVRGIGRSHIIKRPRLTRLLDETDARIILLIAPAGYGKTTLAREWLSGRPNAWYRGTPSSSDVAALALGLAAAGSRIVPRAGEALQARLRVSRAPIDEVDRLANLLSSDFDQWPEDAWLVFDDYQFTCDSEAAERFVERLAWESGVRLLIASRTRPCWASARRMLYGEVFEVGRNVLAMNNDEAETVLGRQGAQEAEGLLFLADGWPALIGLTSAATSREVPGEVVPEDLYAFIAEELYSATSPEVKRGLRRLALAPYVTADIAEAVVRDDPDEVISQGLELGFFSTHREQLELHPLLRTFLATKFRKRLDDPTGECIASLAHVLTTREAWDDVFELASRFAEDEVLMNLIDVALAPMLEQARLSTLDRWLARAKSRRLDSPLIDLADAELALRRGEFARAEALACQSTRRFEHDDPKVSRAWWIAGTSAHLTGDDEASSRYFQEAENVASSEEDTSRAVWGRFLAADCLERNREAAALLARLIERSAETVDERLLIVMGQVRTALLSGNLRSALDDTASLVHLIDRSRDPLVRSSFLQTRAYLLSLCGQYEEALEAGKFEIDYVRSTYLDFVLPYGHLNVALAQLGLRQFRESQQSLAQCSRSAKNDFVAANMHIGRARICLATHQFNEALRILERAYPVAKSCLAAHAEYLAWWSFAEAAAGNGYKATELIAQTEALSHRIEASALIPWTRAVLASSEHSARRRAHTAFKITLQTTNMTHSSPRTEPIRGSCNFYLKAVQLQSG